MTNNKQPTTTKFYFTYPAILLMLAGCVSISTPEENPTPTPSATETVELGSRNEGENTASPITTPKPLIATSPSLPVGTINRELLEESWAIYRQQFIQQDGRVIDFQASDRSTSEGQAYAMLRAVLINDTSTFAQTLNWAEKNLLRVDETGKPSDQLWAWKWGKNEAGKWGAIDRNFASDADIDAITALILASRRWQRLEYLELAREKLMDLWNFSTTVQGGKRYLLPGPKEAFVPSPNTIYLNPSYFAPYAFRLFAQVDPNRDWLSLVNSSYQVLEKSSQVSSVGLPSDWIALDTKTGKYEPLPASSPLKSVYSFDAYRVWWRVAWDVALFSSPEGDRYLRTASSHLLSSWRSKQNLPAAIDLQGKPTVDYETTSQYAMLYPTLRIIDPDMAQQQLQTKLLPRYKQGIWDDQSAYYTQNLAWLGLLPTTAIDPQLLRP